MTSLAAEFQARGPWVTRFRVAGMELGGDYLAEADPRLARFFEHFPNPGRVLELGCLEGGHTFPLARRATAVVAIDARADNLARARWLARFYPSHNIRFEQADLEHAPLDQLGPFDVVFNVGLLYHLVEPWGLLARLARLAPWLFLWTHVARDFGLFGRRRVIRGGYRGVLYAEHGFADPLSGTTGSSFWPTPSELDRMLADCGFTDRQVLEVDWRHRHGPSILLVCRSGKYSR